MIRLTSGADLVSGALSVSTCIYIYKALYSAKEDNKVHRPLDDNDNLLRNFFQRNFVLSRSNVRAGRSHTFLTSTFNHGSLIHLILNMRGLWVYGNILVPLIGPGNTAIVYVGSAAVGGWLTLLLEKSATRVVAGRRCVIEHGFIGANSSVLGLMTAFAILFPNRSTMLWPGLIVPAWMETVAYAIYNGWCYYGYPRSSENIVYLGQLGGMIFGAAFSLLPKRFNVSVWQL